MCRLPFKRLLSTILLFLLAFFPFQTASAGAHYYPDGTPSSSIGNLSVQYLLNGRMNDADALIYSNRFIDERRMFLNDEVADADIANGIDWDYAGSRNPRTTQLYIQCLMPLRYLVTSYLSQGDAKYMAAAAGLIESWLVYQSKKPDNPFLMYDHTVASRSEALVLFMLAAENGSFSIRPELADEINGLLKYNAEWLYSDKNYASSNHGLFEDGALLELSLFFPREEHSRQWRMKAESRIVRRCNTDFTGEAVHIENSPGYHEMMLSMLTDIYQFIAHYGYDAELPASFPGFLDQLADYIVYSSDPEGLMPPLGDTKRIKIPYDYGNPELRYVVTQGREGTAPASLSKVYPNSGYAYFRDRWCRADDYGNAMWCMFRAGYKTTVHRHCDDLSFMIASSGYDLFVDSGAFSYETGTSKRNYALSALAHNTVVVNNESYEPNTRAFTGLVKFYDMTRGTNLNYVVGTNGIYSGVLIERHFVNIDSRLTLLVDNIRSAGQNTYSQYFHCGKDMTLDGYDTNGFTLRSPDGAVSAYVRQLNASDKAVDYYGESKGLFSLYSPSFTSEIPIHTLKYSKTGKTQQFITLIEAVKQDERPYANVSYIMKNGILELSAADDEGTIHTYKVPLRVKPLIMLNKGDKIDLNQVLKQYGFKQPKSCKSSNAAVASVSRKGLITAKKAGAAKVYAFDTTGRVITIDVSISNTKPLRASALTIYGGSTRRGLSLVKTKCGTVTGGVKTYRYVWTVYDMATNRVIANQNGKSQLFSWQPPRYGKYRIACKVVDLAGGNVTKTADIVIKK